MHACMYKIEDYEGSCDSEDWNNKANISALHHRNKMHFKNIIDISYFKS